MLNKAIALALVFIVLSAKPARSGQSPGEGRPDGDTFVLPAEGMRYRRISPHAYAGGSPDFFLLETEVTNEMYLRYLRATGRAKGDQELADAERRRQESGDQKWTTASAVYDLESTNLLWISNAPPIGLENYPVALITIQDAKNFCEWLNERYPNVGHFRLPTVQEWLIAAYGDDRDFPWGNEWSFDIPCVSDSNQSRRTTTEPVKTHAKDKTPEGIYGLWGNVAEYVLDPVDFPNETRWMGPSFKSHPIPGEPGLFPFTARNAWWGYGHNSASKSEDTGLRVLLELPRDTQPDAAPEPPPTAPVQDATEPMNPKPESEAPADGGGL